MMRHLAWPLLAAVLIIGTALVSGTGIEGYAHARHSLALPGAAGMPGWRIVNVLMFVLPGLSMAVLAWRLRSDLADGSSWALRMALQLGLLSALGFALQGVFNLDPGRLLDDGANRLHALAWMAWWLCFALSALMLAASGGLSRGVRLPALLLGLATPLLVLAAPVLWPAALAQRIGIASWLAGGAALACVLARRGDGRSPR